MTLRFGGERRTICATRAGWEVELDLKYIYMHREGHPQMTS